MSYVRLIADHSLTSLAIRGFLHESFSHVGFKMDDETWLDCRWGIGDSDGVRIRPAGSVHDCAHVDFTFDGIEDAIIYGKSLIGTKYDLSDIAGFVFDPAIHDPHKLICSRFVIECAAKIGNPLFDEAVSFWNIPPGWFPASMPRGKKILDLWPTDLKL